MRACLACCFCLLLFSGTTRGNEDVHRFECSSPDRSLTLRIQVNDRIGYELYKNDRMILSLSHLSLTVAGQPVLGRNPGLPEAEQQEKRQELWPDVRQKSDRIDDHYNELTLNFSQGFSVIFRAYDDGVAYRFVTRLQGEIKVVSEEVTFAFPEDLSVYFPQEESFHTHSERYYQRITTDKIVPEMFCSLPALFEYQDGMKALITEADLDDYPGLYLRGTASSSIEGIFPPFPLKQKQTTDRDVIVEEAADYIASTQGAREFPWRTMIVTEEDKELIESQMIYKLSSPLVLEETSWVKPGKVSWDWYNGNNVFNVDFRAGINTETYKYYIDFASRFKIEYIILDEGWYVLGNLLEVSEGLDMEEVFRYAKEKNVGVILWVSWKTLDDQLKEALDQFQAGGAKGIKVDFMQRDDQWMVNYYLKVAQEAAKRHLLVDFHGSFKPTGLRRAYPNVITREGLRGLEQNKWSRDLTPEHNVTLPFIRMVAGPMDYTPGSMVNAQAHNYSPVFFRPMSQGTRCHQLAMYVIYESPLQMLADSPSQYLRNSECMEFLSCVPTVWDETVVLDAKVADFVFLARRNSKDWYVGGMTDGTSRTYKLDLSFLDPGKYNLTLFRDGINADRFAEDYKKITAEVTPEDAVEIVLAPGGGFAGFLIRE